jgi:uncharacterized protein with GYD domain
MAKYLVTSSYSVDGLKGVVAKGGSARVAAAEALVASAGGTLECFYFGFGDRDAYLIIDLPDNVGAAAIAMAVGAAGMASVQTTVLLTAEEIDRAAATKVDYTPPGG